MITVNRKIFLARLAPLTLVVSSLMLAGCPLAVTPASTDTSTGSGGSGGTSIAAAAPATTVPASSYTGTNLAIFNALNVYRAKVDLHGGPGVGLVAQNTALDTAAAAHESYLTAQPGGFIEDHNEQANGVMYFEANPHSRAVKAGFTPTSAWIGEVIGSGDPTLDTKSGLPTCLGQMLDTVYHLEALTSNVEQIGIFDDPKWTCVLEGATVTGTQNLILPSSGNAEPAGGGQQLVAGTPGVSPYDGGIAVSPYNGEQGALPAMSLGENPIPNLPSAHPGHPVMLRVRADSAADVLRVDSFTLTPSSSGAQVVTGTILVASNATASSVGSVLGDALVAAGVAFFVPAAPLASATTYTAHFLGARNGVKVDATWSFVTQ